MARAKDPTEPIRNKAAAFPDVIEGTSCNQTSFKTGKTAFFYCGPGAKGQGFKAMFKLERSLPQAEKLAAKEPDRFGAGSGGWVSGGCWGSSCLCSGHEGAAVEGLPAVVLGTGRVELRANVGNRHGIRRTPPAAKDAAARPRRVP